MSALSDNELDLEKLFLPAWAQEPSTAKYANYQGGEERSDRRDQRGERRGPRRPRDFGPMDRGKGDRPPGRGSGPSRERSARPPRADGDRSPRAGGPRPQRHGAPRSQLGPRPDHGATTERAPRPELVPLPDLNVSMVPEAKGVESLARQIKMTGRAFPLFDIAQLILQKPERYAFVIGVKKNAEGQPTQPLFGCALDETLWLSEDEAIAHVLRKHFSTFYQAERTATEPPKGTYTFVAQCGMSGVVLGPPNHHDYQNQLRKLHSERFSRMPFEVYKSRVKIVRDEVVVKKWIEDQSWRTEYICLNMPEPLKLATMEGVEKHFRDTHKDNIIKPVSSQTLPGSAARNLRSQGLVRLTRSTWEDQRRFPLQIATALSHQFAGHGLQFFKVNRTITHVCVARPHYLDLEATPVSDGVRRIVEFINANPKCSRRKLIEALANVGQPRMLSGLPTPATGAPETPNAPSVPPAPQPNPEPTPEQTAVIADLHWLIHQGHVIEFANGTLETAKKPLPKPPKPEPAPAAELQGPEVPVPATETGGLTPALPDTPQDQPTNTEMRTESSAPEQTLLAQPAPPMLEAAPAASSHSVAPHTPMEDGVAEGQETTTDHGIHSIETHNVSPSPEVRSGEATDIVPAAPG